MSNVVIEFQEDTRTAFCLHVAYHDGDFLCVQYISKGDLVEYRLSLSHVQNIKSVSSLDELLSYARTNNNIKSYPKDNQNTSLRETLCPCPPETPSTDICSVTDGVDGGILPVIERLKEIKQQVSLINAGAYDASLLSDDQHYKLLDIEMLIDDFIAPYSYREVL